MKAVFQSSLNVADRNNVENSQFYQNSYLSSFNFTKSSLAYYQEYFGGSFSDRSILVFNNETPVLALIAYSESNKLTHFGSAIRIIEGEFESVDQRQSAYRALIQKLNDLIKAESIEEIYFYSNEFLNSEYFSKISKTETEYSAIVDLNIPIDNIKMNIRKSYKSLVNWGKNNLDIYIMKGENASLEKFSLFKDFHIQVAEKKTRSDETWEKQYDAIVLNEAFLVMAYLEGQLVSGSYIMLGKDIAYYGVGVYDRELMAKNLPIAHYNILTSINLAKELNRDNFDLGFINSDNNNTKELNIFKFKSGFSNQIVVNNKFIVKFVNEVAGAQ